MVLQNSEPSLASCVHPVDNFDTLLCGYGKLQAEAFIEYALPGCDVAVRHGWIG